MAVLDEFSNSTPHSTENSRAALISSHMIQLLKHRPTFNLSDVCTKEEVALTSKREELLLLSVAPSLAVEVDRSKIIKRLQQTFSL